MEKCKIYGVLALTSQVLRKYQQQHLLPYISLTVAATISKSNQLLFASSLAKESCSSKTFYSVRNTPFAYNWLCVFSLDKMCMISCVNHCTFTMFKKVSAINCFVCVLCVSVSVIEIIHKIYTRRKPLLSSERLIKEQICLQIFAYIPAIWTPLGFCVLLHV